MAYKPLRFSGSEVKGSLERVRVSEIKNNKSIENPER